MGEYTGMSKAELAKLIGERDVEISVLKGKMSQIKKDHRKEIKRLVGPGAAGFEVINSEITVREKEITALQNRKAEVQGFELREVEKNAVSARYQKDIERLIKQIDGLNNELTEV